MEGGFMPNANVDPEAARLPEPAIDEPGVNPDPLTGAPGAHPVGTGLGAVSGAAAGASLGAAAGPVGAAVGTVVGALAGALAGKGAAEAVHPTVYTPPRPAGPSRREM
jgi:phage tail tape-measure protein